MFFLSGSYYPFICTLQVVCVIHCLAKSTEYKWIWLIVFLPLIGSLIYLYTEFFANKSMQQVYGLGDVFYPKGKIKKLENQLRFADTFTNKIALADAYLASNEVAKAIELYKQSLTGAFTDNEYVYKQLIIAYLDQKNYAAIIPLAKKIYKLPQFARSHTHIAYALALEHTGSPEQAEEEFKLMRGRYAQYEGRYQYGLFLVRAGRTQDAKKIFNGILEEASHLAGRERSANRKIFGLVKDELKKING